jgi:hypothetical protein
MVAAPCWVVDMWTSILVGGWVLGHRGTVQEVARRYDLFTSGRGRPHNRICHGRTREAPVTGQQTL